MFERFGRELKDRVKLARDIAAADGEPAVEAQHLLLALLDAPEGPAAGALGRLGWSAERVRHALEREHASALAAVGVTAPASGRRVRRPSRGAVPSWGQSAKLALERTLQQAMRYGDRRLDERHLLLAIVSAEAGVVPRLLAELDVGAEQVERELMGGRLLAEP